MSSRSEARRGTRRCDMCEAEDVPTVMIQVGIANLLRRARLCEHCAEPFRVVLARLAGAPARPVRRMVSMEELRRERLARGGPR
jgi:hypothetical protein